VVFKLCANYKNIEILFSNTGLTHYGGFIFFNSFSEDQTCLPLPVRFDFSNQQSLFRQHPSSYSLSDRSRIGRIRQHSPATNGVSNIGQLPTYPDPTTLQRFLERFGSRLTTKAFTINFEATFDEANLCHRHFRSRQKF
jgi:hypothetical protein